MTPLRQIVRKDAFSKVEAPVVSKTKLSPAVVSRLLDLLCSDDDFRDLFKRDPMGALIYSGHSFSTDQQDAELREVQFFPELRCLLVGELAPKEEIAATRDLIQNYLLSTGTHTVVFAFEAGKVLVTLDRQ